MSINHIDTCQYDGGRKLILGKTIDSGGGGGIDRLASELKIWVALVSSISLSTAEFTPSIRHCRKVWNKSMA